MSASLITSVFIMMSDTHPPKFIMHLSFFTYYLLGIFPFPKDLNHLRGSSNNAIALCSIFSSQYELYHSLKYYQFKKSHGEIHLKHMGISILHVTADSVT